MSEEKFWFVRPRGCSAKAPHTEDPEHNDEMNEDHLMTVQEMNEYALELYNTQWEYHWKEKTHLEAQVRYLLGKYEDKRLTEDGELKPLDDLDRALIACTPSFEALLEEQKEK